MLFFSITAGFKIPSLRCLFVYRKYKVSLRESPRWGVAVRYRVLCFDLLYALSHYTYTFLSYPDCAMLSWQEFPFFFFTFPSLPHLFDKAPPPACCPLYSLYIYSRTLSLPDITIHYTLISRRWIHFIYAYIYTSSR